MANVFSTDLDCIAVYRFENAALTVDSQGSNTLTNSGAAANVADYQEGAACVDIVESESDYMECADADLDSGFPGKSGESHNFLSVGCWFKLRSWGEEAEAPICGKWFTGYSLSWSLYVYSTGDAHSIRIKWSTDGGAANTSIGIGSLSLNVWYHVVVTLNAVNDRVYIRLWDDSGETVSTVTETGENVIIAPETLSFQIGRFYSYVLGTYDGYIDELAIFKDELTADEIDAIRQGNYGDHIFLSGRANAVAALTGELAGPIGMCVDMARFHPETRYREQLAWRTNIIKSADGSGQRLATRRPPRQRITLPYILPTPQDSARATAMLHRWAKGQFGMPIWHERVITHATLTAGATTVGIDTTAGDFRDDSFALIWQADQYEVIDIATITDSQLSLSAPLVNTYTGRTFVMPYRRARLIGRPRRRRYRGGGAILDMPFEVIDNAEITGHSEASSYDSMEVVTEPAYLPDGVYDEGHDPDVIVLDGQTGAVEVANVSDFNITDQPHVFVSETQAEAWAYRQWLHAKYGRQKKFLVPSFHRDFQLTRQIGAADTTVYVANIGLTANVGANALREYIGFRTGGRGSTLTVRRITAVSQVDSAEESITIDAAVGAIIPLASLVCWVDQCRLASDTIDIDWYLPGKCVSNARLARVI